MEEKKRCIKQCRHGQQPGPTLSEVSSVSGSGPEVGRSTLCSRDDRGLLGVACSPGRLESIVSGRKSTSVRLADCARFPHVNLLAEPLRAPCFWVCVWRDRTGERGDLPRCLPTRAGWGEAGAVTVAVLSRRQLRLWFVF
jgi:hypothetical protein